MVAADALAQQAFHGHFSVNVLLRTYTFTLSAASLATLTRLWLDRSAAFIERSALEVGHSRVQLAEEQEREWESTARRGELVERVGPFLQRIVAGGSLSPDERVAMLRAEAETRDRLVADVLVDERVRNAAKAARDRGVRVDLIAKPSMERSREVEAFREVLLAALAIAPSPGHVNAQWAPSSRRRGTIAIVGGVPQAGLELIRSTARRVVRQLAVEVDADEDSVLVACTEPAPATPQAPSP